MSRDSGILSVEQTSARCRFGSLLITLVGLGAGGFGVYDYVQQNQAVENAVEVDATSWPLLFTAIGALFVLVGGYSALKSVVGR